MRASKNWLLWNAESLKYVLSRDSDGMIQDLKASKEIPIVHLCVQQNIAVKY